MSENNQLVLFEEKAISLMKGLSEIKKAKDELEEQDKWLREAILNAMNQYGITSFKNEYVTISNIAPSETVSVDLKKLKEKEPECYNGLIEDYPKVTKKAGYVRIVVK